MAKRSYRQNCALARTADVVGDRWTLLLLRDLLVAPRRFTDLERSLRGIGANLLTSRLRELEAAGLIEQRRDADAVGHVYAVADRGRALEPAILALIRWGLVHGPGNRDGFYHQDDWDLLALKALFQPDRARHLAVSVQFAAPGFRGWVVIDSGSMAVGLGDAEAPDLTLRGTIRDVFVERRPGDEVLASGTAADLDRFTAAFALRG